MAAGPRKRRRDERDGEEDRRRLMASASRTSDVTTQMRHRRQRDGPSGDRQAYRRRLAHVVPGHARVRQAHGQREARDQNGGEDTGVAASDCPAESG